MAIDDSLERGPALDARVLARLVRPRHEVTIAVPGRRDVRVGATLKGAVLAQRSPLAQSAVVTARASKHEVDERVAGEWALIAGLGFGGVLAAVALGVAQARGWPSRWSVWPGPRGGWAPATSPPARGASRSRRSTSPPPRSTPPR